MLIKKMTHVWRPVRLWALVGAFLLPLLVQAQEKNLPGTVNDETGKPVPNVTVSIKNSTVATSTDATGKFSITASPGDTLLFSSVNYVLNETRVGEQSSVNIVLIAKSGTLEDVVVVGYGTRKKVDLTGAVSVVDKKMIENRPITNLSSALAGLVPGAYVRQGSGMPGQNTATITIRGAATLNSTSPLVIVDGIIGNLNSVNPQDVEGVTFLKDAASVAIYGAQGANGVIIVTTKKGTGAPRVSYTNTFSITTPTGLPRFVTNSAQYMELINEGAKNLSTGTLSFDSTTIATWRNASMHPNDTSAFGYPNYVAYPNTDWVSFIFQRKLLQNHNISVSGGNKDIRYLMSLGYLNDPGIVTGSNYSRYNFRVNLESNIGKNIVVGTQTYGVYSQNSLFNLNNFLSDLRSSLPLVYPEYQGKYGTNAYGNNILAKYTQPLGSAPETYINTTWYGKVKILKGLTFEPKFNYTTDFSESNSRTNQATSQLWNFTTNTVGTAMTPTSQLVTSSAYTKAWNYTLESLLRYNTTLANAHHIGALAGFNQYYTQTSNLSASGVGLIDPSVTAIGAALTFPSNPSGSATAWSMRSLFGRINYDYKDRYLLEANIRRDQSSRFGPNFRTGNFPSVAVGWNLSKESFLQSFFQSANIQNLKLKASYGSNGSTASLNNYTWQALYAQVLNSYNGVAAQGLAQSVNPNPFLHWETTKQTDIGLELTAFKRLNFEIDWFRKYTYDLIYAPAIDPTSGTASAPQQNLAKAGQSGIELNLGWNDKAGDFSYGMSGNFTYLYANKILKYKGPLVTTVVTNEDGSKTVTTNINVVSANSGSTTQIIEGFPINEYYLRTLYRGTGAYKEGGEVTPTNGPKDGMIRTADDLAWVKAMQEAGYQFQPSNNVISTGLYYGDFIYANNDGDKVFGGLNDRKFMNVSATPKITYGFSLNASYKGIDLNIIWAGAAGMKYYWNQDFANGTGVTAGATVPLAVAENHYYFNVNNPNDSKNNINGLYPRLKTTDVINNAANEFWLYSGSYLKLKNLQLGYTIPESIIKHAGIVKSLRIYVSGENLLTITKFPGLDPEVGAGLFYPILKQYAFGLNVNF